MTAAQMVLKKAPPASESTPASLAFAQPSGSKLSSVKLLSPSGDAAIVVQQLQSPSVAIAGSAILEGLLSFEPLPRRIDGSLVYDAASDFDRNATLQRTASRRVSALLDPPASPRSPKNGELEAQLRALSDRTRSRIAMLERTAPKLPSHTAHRSHEAP